MALTPRDGARADGPVRVGLIGIGRMGLPIARNLLERGFEVTGYRRSGCAELVAAGGRAAGSPAQVAAASDVLVSILPDADAVEEVVTGPSGTLQELRPGTVHVEMSTIDVGRKRALRSAAVAAGGELLDSPISGTPGMVAPRLATTFASGDAGAVERVRPVLDAVSGPWVYTGAFGTGARTKYVANLLVAVHTVATAEAMVLAERLGLDVPLVQQALEPSIASSAIWRQRGPVMVRREWQPAPGPIATLHDILEQIAAAAEAVEATTPLFDVSKGLFDRAMAQGWGALDIAAVHAQLAGADALDPGPRPPSTPQESQP